MREMKTLGLCGKPWPTAGSAAGSSRSGGRSQSPAARGCGQRPPTLVSAPTRLHKPGKNNAAYQQLVLA